MPPWASSIDCVQPAGAAAGRVIATRQTELFATRAAALHGRAHRGCRCAVARGSISAAAWRALFGTPGELHRTKRRSAPGLDSSRAEAGPAPRARVSMTTLRRGLLGLISSAAMLVVGAAPASAQAVFVNEVHYDNVGGDRDEGIELAGPAGTDLSSYSIELYNGYDGLAICYAGPGRAASGSGERVRGRLLRHAGTAERGPGRTRADRTGRCRADHGLRGDLWSRGRISGGLCL